jgi:uncharacterized glyoxalase superfamily metalloenzyme YdcJ
MLLRGLPSLVLTNGVGDDVTMAFTEQWQLRAEFARRLSVLYGTEVPAYTTLVDVSQEINRGVLTARGADAERLGSIERVTAERHGAIRVGNPTEMSQVAKIFAAMGMYPVGFYDLRDAATSSVPVVSTAFRPVEPHELARNPFRVFTSMLVTSDRRFFSAALQARLETFLAARHLFSRELLSLADRASTDQGLQPGDAERFLVLATAAFKLSTTPVDRAWYEELHGVSAVAADIGGTTRTHVNHLTPRVLDIDALYHRMHARGIDMIDAIQGPPRWEGPDLLLRQTSFRALAEQRRFREADGQVRCGDVRVRFGEVESRGIAVTPAGRRLYDELITATERAITDGGLASITAEGRNEVAAHIWRRRVPLTETQLAAEDLAYFTFHVDDAHRPRGATPPHDLRSLLDQRWILPEPVVYEDFLPKSAAGIFQSNLTCDGYRDDTQAVAQIDAEWLEGTLETALHDPDDLYRYIRDRSLATVARHLGITGHIDVTPRTAAPEGHPA